MIPLYLKKARDEVEFRKYYLTSNAAMYKLQKELGETYILSVAFDIYHK